MEQRKLRILALHGWKQSATVFRSKTGSFRRQLRDVAELEFLDAPFEVPDTALPAAQGALAPPPSGERDPPPPSESCRTWWLFDGTKEGPITYSGFDVAYRAICDALSGPQGPFDGVLGFSQGAAVAAAFLQRYVRETDEKAGTVSSPLRFAILISGFPPRDEQLFPSRPLPENVTPIPAAVLLGKVDTIIAPAVTKLLLPFFPSPSSTVIEHDRGHVVPTDDATINQLRAFLEEFRTGHEGAFGVGPQPKL